MSNLKTPELIQSLVAFISTVAHSALPTEQRLTSSDDVPDDSCIHSAAYQTDSDKVRLEVVLDTLANVCISNPHHEVLAVGLRYTTKSGVQLTIAGNSGVPSSTVEHLRELWGLLISLSAVYSTQIGGTEM